MAEQKYAKTKQGVKDAAKQYVATAKAHHTGKAGAGAGSPTDTWSGSVKYANTLARDLETFGDKARADEVRSWALKTRPTKTKRGVSVK